MSFERAISWDSIKTQVNLLLCLLLFCSSGFPVSGKEVSGKPSSSRFVFAHYMVCCPLHGMGTTDYEYQDEISFAHSSGIDGFALNVGSWLKEPYYQKITRSLFVAAEKRSPDFRLFFSIDYLTVDETVLAMTEFSSSPNYLKVNGRPVLSTYGGTSAWSNEVRKKLELKGIQVFFVPAFHYGNDDPGARSEIGGPEIHSVRRALDENPDMDGYFLFGAGSDPATLVQQMRIAVPLIHNSNRLAMVGISPFYKGFGPKNARLFDTAGFTGMEQQWRAAISAGADWVELVTWNDWSEATYLNRVSAQGRPYVDHPRWRRLNSHDGFLAASRVFIEAFKSGTEPKPDRERIFAFYRTEPATSVGPLNPAPDDSAIGRPAGWEHLANKVYVTAFLNSPGTLIVQLGSAHYQVSLQGGISNVDVPMHTGSVELTFVRQGVATTRTLGKDIGAEGSIATFNYYSEIIKVGH